MNENRYNIVSNYFQTFPQRPQRPGLVVLLLLGLFWSGCGQLYRVAPLARVERGLPSSRLADLVIEARGLDGDRSLEQFDANLPMAGVLAVEVRLTNRGVAPRALTALGYSVEDANGNAYLPLVPREALKSVMKFYGNRIFQISAHQVTKESYEQVALRQSGELAVGEEVHGILFFAIPRQAPLHRGFTLRAGFGPESIRLALTEPFRP